jgi:cytochrome d ubiquinol oxidase subunit I
MVTELGRQPWIVYALLRTADGTSPTVAAGDVVFSTLGYMGLYFVVGVGFLGLLAKTLGRGPIPGAEVAIATPIGGEV